MVETMQAILLAAAPDGLPKESDFRIESVPVPECPPGGLLVHTRWLSVDPYLRGRMTGIRTYVEGFRVGQPIESGAVGGVLVSDTELFHPGDMVLGNWGWQEFAALEPRAVQKLDPDEAPVSTSLGILGVPGMTAYFGLLEICNPQPGETVVVSGAAGAVGSAAGQIAKILGCRVVGSAGTDEKVQWLRSLGFDGALNYRTSKPYGEKLQELCPKGIDCYFDNTGGDFTEAVLPLMNLRGRISVCGQISQYNDLSQDRGARPWWMMIVRQLRAEGFIVTRWFDRWPQARTVMAGWLREGKLQYRETVYEGLASAPRAFIGLFTGENTGKAVVRL
jgi:NADPH-dependent curcumin reductase CurA